MNPQMDVKHNGIDTLTTDVRCVKYIQNGDCDREVSSKSPTNGPAAQDSPDGREGESTGRKCCRYGPAFWCRKYFWEGQMLHERDAEAKDNLATDAPWYKKAMVHQRRLLGFIIPALFFHFFWWGLAIKQSYWGLFTTRWPMCITMVFGSVIAGMTSEGGGAVAFPVMTLALKINPSIARDFSMMIQSCGMSAAAFTIYFMHVTIERCSLVCCSLGGAAGMIFGLHVVDPRLSPQAKKLGFVSIWFAFASVLIFLNRTHKRPTFSLIPSFSAWKALVLIATGFLGGIFTSFAGSGLDICSFSILTLLFRVSEKVATPTSVVLMAGNSLVGFYWRGVMMGGISQDAWEYLAVCVPIVVFGAPIGSVLGSHFHRLVLASLVIAIDVVALVSAYAIVRPLSPELIGASVGLIVGFIVFFIGMTFAGQKMLDTIHLNRQASGDDLESDIKKEPLDVDVSNGTVPATVACPSSGTVTGIVNPAFTQDLGSTCTKI